MTTAAAVWPRCRGPAIDGCCVCRDARLRRLRPGAAGDVETFVAGEEVEPRMGIPEVDTVPFREDLGAEEKVEGDVLQRALSDRVSPSPEWRAGT